MARLVLWLAFAALTAAQSGTSGFAGVWSLNRQLSQFPRELGFNADWFPTSDTPSRTAPLPRRESYEEGQRARLLTDEVRNPPARLMIVDNISAVTITNDLGQSRTVHPNAKEELIDIQGVAMPVTTARDGSRLIVTYHVETDRDVRFTYTPGADRLTVDAQFLEKGKGDTITRVYEPGVAVARAAPAPGAAGSIPALPDVPHENFDQTPGAEFKGLKSVGILVEDLGPEAIACGLKRDAIENTLAQRLSAGGLTVKKNSDEDTYVYVNLVTTGMPNGTCVTRYDAFLYTHATAKLAYHEQPVLVQVSLMHRGGIGTSGMATHAASVTHGLENYVDLFLTQIHDANK